MKKKKPSEEGIKEQGLKDITYEDVKRMVQIIDAIPKRDLPRIYRDLVRGKWVEELGEKPADFEEKGACPEQQFFLQLIELRCGEKAISRYEHTAELGYTDQEFEDWWDSFALRQLKEEQKEFYDRYCRSNSSDDKGNYCGLFIESILFFFIGFLIAAVLFKFIG